MESLLLIKQLQQVYLGKVTLKNNYHIRLLRPVQPNAGFTLIELIAVILMVGILAAIAAPGWLAFTNRQRVNKVNDAVLSALQEAQREAKKKKLSYSVFFRESSNVVELAINPTKKIDGNDVIPADINNWKPLGGDLNIKSGQFVLRTNMKPDNKADTTASYDFKTPKKITFNYMGHLPPETEIGIPKTTNSSDDALGLKIVVAVPKPGNPTEPGAVKRCVIVKTLLGSMLTEKDDKCN
jgi:prepilin-type N-terminal cleavage/methylation domain-containing protein